MRAGGEIGQKISPGRKKVMWLTWRLPGVPVRRPARGAWPRPSYARWCRDTVGQHHLRHWPPQEGGKHEIHHRPGDDTIATDTWKFINKSIGHYKQDGILWGKEIIISDCINYVDLIIIVYDSIVTVITGRSPNVDHNKNTNSRWTVLPDNSRVAPSGCHM
jgi:hypothetical protein